MNEIITYLINLFPAIITATAVYYLQRRQKKSDAEREKREDEQLKGAKLQLELEMATAKLSYATAVALKRGKANGEVEEGISAYREAEKSYNAFLNAEAIKHLKERD